MSAILTTGAVLVLISYCGVLLTTLAAKVSGVQVNELKLGAGPLLGRFQAGVTLVVIRLFPFTGGAVLAGEGDLEVEQAPKEKWLRNKPWYLRAFVVFWISLFPIVFGVLVLGSDALPVFRTTIPDFFKGVISPLGTAQEALQQFVRVFESEGWLGASAVAAIRVCTLSIIPVFFVCGIGQVIKTLLLLRNSPAFETWNTITALVSLLCMVIWGFAICWFFIASS